MRRICTTSTASACNLLRLAVADTGPLNDLILIGEAALLPRIIARAVGPETVRRDMSHPAAPAAVHDWIHAPPSWLKIEPTLGHSDPALANLDNGERDAIALAGAISADLILMDDRNGVQAARARGFAVTGTLGLLALADRRKLIDLPDAIAKLRATNFRCRPDLSDVLLAQHRREHDTES